MKRLVDQSLYEILEVPPDASTMEIERAYARALELYGPGSLATYSLVGPEETALLKDRIEEAKRTLLDPESRARYDARLAAESLAAEAAVRIASTGSGAVAAGPQRPWLVPPTSTPPPRTERPAPEAGAKAPGESEAPTPTEAKAVEPSASIAQAKDGSTEPAPTGTATEPPKVEAAPAPEAEAEPKAAAEPAPTPEVAPAEAPAPAVPAAPSPILLKKEVHAAPREFPVPDGAVWSGEALRKVRESRGLSVREVCERTKITPYHLENIEQERFTLLPAPVYLRGILVAVARELRLDGQKVARSYLELMAAGGTPR